MEGVMKMKCMMTFGFLIPNQIFGFKLKILLEK